MVLEIVKVAFSWPEPQGFTVDRPNGISEYHFLHFWDPFELIIDGEKIITAPHACIICAPNTPQHYLCRTESTQDWFRFNGNVDEIIEKYDLKCNTVYYPENFSFISSLVRKMELELTCHNKHYEDICEAYIRELFVLLSREVSTRPTDSNINHTTRNQLIQLRRQLRREYEKQWSINDMAKFVNLSPSYLHASYKQFFGVSPLSDLISIRIERACSMLSDTQKSIAEIALCLGYNNPSHFMRQFQKKMRVSPRKYRQQTKIEDINRERFREEL